jgi:NAD(P)-dependent dehydrogenase (short-subunit alcohol dehydrogenase family)
MLTLEAPQWLPALLCLVPAAAFALGLRRRTAGREVWRYDPVAAWLRAFTYFSVCWAIAFASGTVATVLAAPWLEPGQTESWLWWLMSGLVFGIAVVGYWVVWARGTRPHGRRVCWPETPLFGLAWGISEALLLASVWVVLTRLWRGLVGDGGLADGLVVASAILVLSLWIALWHALYWDINISPEHNIVEWNVIKVAVVHTPNVVLSICWLTAWENIRLFVLAQTIALLGSAMTMPFPSFARPLPPDPDVPPLGPPTTEPADLTGRTVVLTGGARGMGAEAARRLAELGARIVVLDVDDEGAQTTAAAIRSAGGTADTVHVDLAEPSSVRAAAEQVLALCPRIDVLLNNAGTFRSRLTRNSDGVESTLAVNHVGPFLLTQLLLDRVVESRGRIVFVSSDAHYQAGRFAEIDTADCWRKPDKADPNAGFAAYNRSKLLVAACARELAERTAGTGVTVNTLTPGALIPTRIYDEVTGPFALFVRVMKPVLRTVDKAMPNYLYVCTSPELDGVSGIYVKDRRPQEAARAVLDPESRRTFWDWTEAAAGAVAAE